MTQDWAVIANEIAKEAGQAAELTGSEKQIKWAKDLVEKFAFAVVSADFKTSEQEEAKAFITWVIKGHTTARWWIDSRDRGYSFRDLLREEWEDEMEEA